MAAMLFAARCALRWRAVTVARRSAAIKSDPRRADAGLHHHIWSKIAVAPDVTSVLLVNHAWLAHFVPEFARHREWLHKKHWWHLKARRAPTLALVLRALGEPISIPYHGDLTVVHDGPGIVGTLRYRPSTLQMPFKLAAVCSLPTVVDSSPQPMSHL